MKSSTTPSFRRRFLELPPEIRRLARKNFKLWRQDPRHPSLHFKRVGDFWSARVGRDYRALALLRGEQVEWFWIGRLRAALVELAWRMVRYQPQYHAVQKRLAVLAKGAQATRAHRKKAIVAVARQLAVDLWRLHTGRCTATILGFK